MVRNIPDMANFIYVRQKHLPYGNGSPLLAAKSLIDDDEAVVYMFGDDLTLSKKPVVKQLINTFYKYKPTAVIAAQEVPRKEVVKYGIFKYKKYSKIPYAVEDIIEKPTIKEAPSRMAQFGRFVLSYEVVDALSKTKKGKGNELWLTDAISNLANQGRTVIALPIEGEWLTTGDPLNYLKATVKYAQQRKDIKKEFNKFLKATVR